MSGAQAVFDEAWDAWVDSRRRWVPADVTVARDPATEIAPYVPARSCLTGSGGGRGHVSGDALDLLRIAAWAHHLGEPEMCDALLRRAATHQAQHLEVLHACSDDADALDEIYRIVPGEDPRGYLFGDDVPESCRSRPIGVLRAEAAWLAYQITRCQSDPALLEPLVLGDDEQVTTALRAAMVAMSESFAVGEVDASQWRAALARSGHAALARDLSEDEAACARARRVLAAWMLQTDGASNPSAIAAHDHLLATLGEVTDEWIHQARAADADPPTPAEQVAHDVRTHGAHSPKRIFDDLPGRHLAQIRAILGIAPLLPEGMITIGVVTDTAAQFAEVTGRLREAGAAHRDVLLMVHDDPRHDDQVVLVARDAVAARIDGRPVMAFIMLPLGVMRSDDEDAQRARAAALLGMDPERIQRHRYPGTHAKDRRLLIYVGAPDEGHAVDTWPERSAEEFTGVGPCDHPRLVPWRLDYPPRVEFDCGECGEVQVLVVPVHRMRDDDLARMKVDEGAFMRHVRARAVIDGDEGVPLTFAELRARDGVMDYPALETED